MDQRTSTPEWPGTPMTEPLKIDEEMVNHKNEFRFVNSIGPPQPKKPRVGPSPLKQPPTSVKMYVGNMTESANPKFVGLITPEKDVTRGEIEKQADLIDWENDVSENVYSQQQQQGDIGRIRRIATIKQDAAKAEAARQLRDKMDGIDSLPSTPQQQQQNQQEEDGDRTWTLCPDCAEFVSPDHCHFHQGAGYIDSIANPLLTAADEEDITEALLDTIVNSVLN